MRKLLLVVCFALLVVGCRKREQEVQPQGSGSSGSSGSSGGTVVTNPPATAVDAGAPKPPATPPKDLDSKEIMNRKDAASEVIVKHVLIGWKDLAAELGDRLDKRAAARTNADA